MSSNYSSSSKDDFFYALNESLRNEYSTQKMSSFINDLLAAINNLDDDPNDGFGFHDDETDFWNGSDYFTVPSSTDYSDPDQINFRIDNNKNREIRDGSPDMFADEQSQNVLNKTNASVGKMIVDMDMFDNNESLRKTEVHEIRNGTGEETPSQSVPIANIALILEEESCDGSVDMFSEFESDVEVMDTDSASSVEINTTKHSSLADHYQNREVKGTPQVNRSINDVGSFTNPYGTINEIGEVSKPADTSLRKSFDSDRDHPGDRHALVNEDPGMEIVTKQKMDQQNVVSSLCGKDENIDEENTELQISQMPGRIVQRSLGSVTDFPEIFPAKPNMPQDNVVRPLHSLDERPNTSIRSQSCQSSPFRGFSPVPPLLHESSCASTDLNTTLCQEYEFTNNFEPIMRSCASPDFYGFPDASALMRQTIQHDHSIAVSSDHHNSIHSSSRSEAALNSTFCEEYESERLLVAYLNATQRDQINLEEAYTQCFSESQNQVSVTGDRHQSLIEEIEKLVLKIQNDLVNGCKLTIAVPYRVSWSNCFVNEERLILQPLGNGGTRIISSKRRIAMIVYVLSFVYKLLINNETCTRREIYYSDPEFTHSQSHVDTAIMDICLALNAPPWEIGILSSSKGLIAGSIKITLEDDTVVDVESFDGGILLPQKTMSIKKVETAARFVLLVEKHTVYEKLLLEDVLNRLGPCILITGKGYPDINTRAILKKIWDDCKCPMYALVDADPYGIDIMLSYRHGSQRMSLFNDNLAIPSIRWIGVLPSEIKKFKLQSLPMTEKDVNRVDSLMKRPYLSTKIYEELLELKRCQKKCEVEALLSSTVVGCIHTHLLRKIQNGEFI